MWTVKGSSVGRKQCTYMELGMLEGLFREEGVGEPRGPVKRTHSRQKHEEARRGRVSIGILLQQRMHQKHS